MYKEKEDTWWKWRRWNPYLSECNQFHSLSLISWKHFMLKRTKLAQKWSSILCAPFPGLRDSQTDGWRSLPGVSVMVFVNETSIWVGDQSEPDSVPPLCRWASGGPPRAREQEEEEGWIDSQSELSTHSLLPPAVILVHRPSGSDRTSTICLFRTLDWEWTTPQLSWSPACRWHIMRLLSLPNHRANSYNKSLLEKESAQSCPTLCNPVDCRPPVHGILQVRILEWVAIPFSSRFSWPRDQTYNLPHCRQILYCLSHQGSPIHLLLYINRYSHGSVSLENPD